MTQVVGYTDSITECECCGKTDLKGTYCLDIDGVELYYGSVCAFKNHGVSADAQKEAKGNFAKNKKNEKLIATYITPLRIELQAHLERLGYPAKNYISEWNRVIELRAKKYKIAI